jgi:DNA-binding Xre family transcriptional regulator
MISYRPLERLLRDKGETVYYLEKKCGISNLSMIINGKTFPKTDIIEKVCNALNCDIQDVIEYSEEEVSLDKVEVDWDKLTDKAKMSGYNLISLAEELGLNRRAIQNAKQARRKLKITIVEDICSLLNCTEQDIV